MTVNPVTIEIGGEKRTLRASNWARRMVPKVCEGKDFAAAIESRLYFPEVLFLFLHDEKGKPPEGLTVEQIALGMPIGEGEDEVYCAILSAMSNAKKKPEEFLEELKTQRELLLTLRRPKTTDGSPTGPSVPKS